MSTPTFTFTVLPTDGRIVRVHGKSLGEVTSQIQDQIQKDLGAFYQFIQKQFGEQPFRLLSVIEGLELAMAKEQEMATQGSLAMAEAFNVERAGYVVAGATLRLQFGRLFRENKLADRFKAFPTEKDALAFLTA